MLPVSSKQIVQFTPDAAKDRDPLPTFSIQVATLVSRAQWRRAVAEQGARWPTDTELFAALRTDLKAVAPDNLDQLLEEIDAFEAAVDGEREKAEPNVIELQKQFSAVAGDFSRTLAARGFWSEIAPLLAAQRFVVGWQHAGVAFRAGPDGVDGAVLEQLPEAWVKQVGWKAIELLTLDKAAEKNSDAPSTSPESPATSTVH